MADTLSEIPIVLPSNPYAPHTGGTPIPVSGPQVGETKRQSTLPEIPVATPQAAAPAPASGGGGLPVIPVTQKPGSNPLSNYIKDRVHSAQQTGQVLAGWESNVWGAWKSALGAGAGADLDVLGTPQREISGEVENIQEHRGPLDSINHLNDIIWHPTPEKVNKARTAVQRGLHLATDADIDTMMHGTLMRHLGMLSPYVQNALKTVNNVGTDTLTDPFALASDVATAARDFPVAANAVRHAARAAAVNPATKPLIHAGVTAGRMVTGQVHNLLVKHGAGEAFAHLKTAVGATRGSGPQIFHNLHDAFVVRPDLLHAGLTPAGRDVRIQLENSQRVQKYKDFTTDEGIVNDADKSVQRYAQYVHLHGSPKRSAAAAGVLPETLRSSAAPSGSMTKTFSAAEIRAMSPEERTEAFKVIRDEVHKNELARKSNQVFGEASGTKLSHVPNPMDWRKYKAPRVAPVAKLAKKAADAGRLGIELNPLPHGGSNIGTLQFLGGGLDAVTRGVAAMVRPADEAVKARLIQGGSAIPDYIGHHTANWFPGYKEAANAMSHVLGQMEYGWRAGMLEHLDRVLGPSEAGTKAEYLKMALINKKLGDYHNLTAFARAFASYGGPYVAYKLGVLPKAVLDSVRNNPLLFETVARTEDQIQQNRQGAHQDKWSGSDPVSETGKMTTNPVGYVIDTATMGLLRDGMELANDWGNASETHETFDQGVLKIIENHIAPLGLAAGAIENAEGKSFAGQPMTFADHMMAVIMGSLNQHIHKFPSQKAEIKNQKYISKHAFTPED
jgi:hypothetical protein